MNTPLKWLMCAGLLALAAPALADQRRHHDTDISISLHSPSLGVHYSDRGRYGHRHGRGCGHYWDGRVWGKPVPYYRDYGYYGHRKPHWKRHHWKRHHWQKHWRKHHRRHHSDGHRHRDDRHDRRRDDRHDHRDRRDDRHDRRDRRRDDRDHRRRHD